MLDIDGYNKIDLQARICKELYDAGNYSEATAQWEHTEDEIDSLTNGIDFYNILTKIELEGQQQNKSKLLDSLGKYFLKVINIQIGKFSFAHYVYICSN